MCKFGGGISCKLSRRTAKRRIARCPNRMGRTRQPQVPKETGPTFDARLRALDERSEPASRERMADAPDAHFPAHGASKRLAIVDLFAWGATKARMSRFNEQECEHLALLARSIERTRDHLEKFSQAPVEELPLDAYERSIVADYRSQLRSVGEAFRQLMDLRLEQSANADQAKRTLFDGYDLLCALQGELVCIVNRY